MAEDFLDSGAERLSAVVSLVGGLQGAPDGRPILRELRRQFHSLTGSGATLGFPSISATARRGEEICLDAERASEPVPAHFLAEWRAIAARLSEEFAGAARQFSTAVSDTSTAAEPVRAGSAPPRVLVAVGDAAVREMLPQRLAQEGFSVEAVATAREARAAWDASLPDALIVDVELPDQRAYALVDELRGRLDGDGPAVLLLSLLGGFLDQPEAIHAGADACFEKPVEWDLLVRKLHQLVERTTAEVPRILMVEDDSSHGAYARAILEGAGYHVRLCDQPRQFAEVMAAYRPDVILMDIVLPEVSGYALARYVRQEDQHATLPILFLTTESELQARIQTVKSGGDDHLIKPVHPALLVASVAARLERARLLRTLLNRDGLTRLLTHTSFMEHAQALVAQSRRRDSEPASLVMIDIDRFKTVNDTHGHQAGDRVLVSLAGLLRRHLRRSDILGRYGGEEFGVLLDQLAEGDAGRLIMRLLHEFARVEHRAPHGAVFRCTFSAGVAGFDRQGMNLERWIQAADGALYGAKRSGRNRVMTHVEWLESVRSSRPA